MAISTSNPKSLISPCLWFDSEAEDAAKFYTSIFPNSEIGSISRYTEGGQSTHQQPLGKVSTVSFRLSGTSFIGLNGGPHFKFSEAVSFQIECQDQAEVDYYWDKLLEGGGKESQCGWLKDRFGLSWQVVPVEMIKMFQAGGEGGKRSMEAMMGMKKLDVTKLREAFEGKGAGK